MDMEDSAKKSDGQETDRWGQEIDREAQSHPAQTIFITISQAELVKKQDHMQRNVHSLNDNGNRTSQDTYSLLAIRCKVRPSVLIDSKRNRRGLSRVTRPLWLYEQVDSLLQEMREVSSCVVDVDPAVSKVLSNCYRRTSTQSSTKARSKALCQTLRNLGMVRDAIRFDDKRRCGATYDVNSRQETVLANQGADEDSDDVEWERSSSPVYGIHLDRSLDPLLPLHEYQTFLQPPLSSALNVR
eukprot:329836-Hanusia_phi.AAC.1